MATARYRADYILGKNAEEIYFTSAFKDEHDLDAYILGGSLYYVSKNVDVRDCWKVSYDRNGNEKCTKCRFRLHDVAYWENPYHSLPSLLGFTVYPRGNMSMDRLIEDTIEVDVAFDNPNDDLCDRNNITLGDDSLWVELKRDSDGLMPCYKKIDDGEQYVETLYKMYPVCVYGTFDNKFVGYNKVIPLDR